MQRSLTSLLLCSLVTFSTASAFAGRTVIKSSFRGFNAFASVSTETLCPEGSEQLSTVKQISVFGSENMSRQTGAPSSEYRGVNVSLRLDECDGSSYTGYFQLDGTAFTGDTNQVTILKSFLADRSVRGTDEWGNMIWIPTGTQSVIEVSLNMTANGDSFSGKTNNTSRSGSVVTKTRMDGSIHTADVVLTAKVAGVPVNFGNGFFFGETSQAKNGTMTVFTE